MSSTYNRNIRRQQERTARKDEQAVLLRRKKTDSRKRHGWLLRIIDKYISRQ